MASASFARDEEILAQDVLFSSENGKVYADTEEFITVCPTYHAVLHRIRLWKSKNNCGEILR